MAHTIASLLIDVDEQVANGFTALHFAVINNNARLVKLYLERGASVDAPAMLDTTNTEIVDNSCGLSPLWFAGALFIPPPSRLEKVEELLIAAEARVTEGYDVCCPLTAAALNEDLRLLLQYMIVAVAVCRQ